jgi:DNA fragmentation factor beta subunit
MFGFFKSSNLKGYKVTDKERTKKYGVAANNLNDLIEKSAKKFDYKGCKLYLATDGTEVTEEDYFQSIPAQTCGGK